MRMTAPKQPRRLSRGAIAAAWLAAAGGAIAVMLIAASAAEGGVYRVAQCHPGYESGRGDLTFERNSDHYVSVASCLDGNGLAVRHDADRTTRDRWGAWSLAVPTGADLRGVRAKVAGTGGGGHVPELLVGMRGSGPVAFGRAAGSSHAARWRGEGAESFLARLRCARSSGCAAGPHARIAIRRIILRLFDETLPAVEPSGPLAGEATRRGTQPLHVLASDSGSGVHKVFAEVNERPIAVRRLHCEVRGAMATRVQPCPESAELSFSLDTTATPFAQGINRLRVCAHDLAITSDRNRDCASHHVRIDNACPVDDASNKGTLHARIVGAGPRNTVDYGGSAAIAGRLVDDSGEGVAGAEVCVATRTDTPEAIERVVATPTTGADGRFEARLAPGPSREVRIAHWAGARRVAERYERLRVRAHPRFKVSPSRTLHNGERVRFGVRVHGPEAGGVRFHIRVRTANGWAQVRTETTNEAGRWNGAYRFHATSGTRTYRFRAFVRHQPGYPFESGWSATRRVRVSG
jgi:hypothetical protein